MHPFLIFKQSVNHILLILLCHLIPLVILVISLISSFLALAFEILRLLFLKFKLLDSLFISLLKFQYFFLFCLLIWVLIRLLIFVFGDWFLRICSKILFSKIRLSINIFVCWLIYNDFRFWYIYFGFYHYLSLLDILDNGILNLCFRTVFLKYLKHFLFNI